MTDIPVPQLPVGHPDRLIHCEELLEPAFLVLAARAEKAGWNPDEVALALQSLADNYLLVRDGSAETEAAISAARKPAPH